MAIFVDYLMRKSLKVQDWIREFHKSSYIMDEMCVYILSRIMGTGIGIVLKNSIWTTKKDNDMTDLDIWFAYLGLGSYLPLTPLDPEEERRLIKAYMPEICHQICTEKKWSEVSFLMLMKSLP